MSSPRNKKDDLDIDMENMDKPEEKEEEDLVLTARKFEQIPDMFKGGGTRNTAQIVDILAKKEKLAELDHKLGGKFDQDITKDIAKDIANAKQEKKKESKFKRLSGKFLSNKDTNKEEKENKEIGSKRKMTK